MAECDDIENVATGVMALHLAETAVLPMMCSQHANISEWQI